MREILLTVHILAAAAWIGGGLFAGTSYPVMARSVGLEKLGELDDAVGSKYFGASVVVLILTGVALVLMSETYGWTTAFVLIGIGAVVVDSALEGAVFGPRLRRAAEANDLPRFINTIRLTAVVHVALLAFVVWAMVVKLGL